MSVNVKVLQPKYVSVGKGGGKKQRDLIEQDYIQTL